MQTRRALGRGLESLIPPTTVVPVKNEQSGEGIIKADIDDIVPSPLQPRSLFDEESIKELAESIKEKGIIQPLIVSKLPDGRYELVAGERRLRASRLAGLDFVPVIVKDLDPQEHLEMSIIENIQREDLNAIEEARAFNELLEKFGISHEDIATKVGKSRTAVTNSIRLLKLPKVVQDDVAQGRISAGHARALLGVKSIHEQLKMREQILRQTVTVRDIERMVQKEEVRSARKRPSKKSSALSPQMQLIVDKLRVALGTKVDINQKGEGGSLIIEYYSSEDLDRLYNKLVGDN